MSAGMPRLVKGLSLKMQTFPLASCQRETEFGRVTPGAYRMQVPFIRASHDSRGLS